MTLTIRLQASRATFRHIDLPTNPEQAAAMDSIQGCNSIDI